MSEIEKMYENAGINKIGIKRCSGIKQGICQHNCNECESFDYKYPPFTAEKVICLLEWEANRGIINIKHSQKGYQLFTYIHTGNYGKSIINAVASYFCVKWQDLTSEEKQQVKEILECHANIENIKKEELKCQ